MTNDEFVQYVTDELRRREINCVFSAIYQNEEYVKTIVRGSQEKVIITIVSVLDETAGPVALNAMAIHTTKHASEDKGEKEEKSTPLITQN